MVRSLRWSDRLVWVGLAFGFAACGLDAAVPGGRSNAWKGSGGSAPSGAGAKASGAPSQGRNTSSTADVTAGYRRTSVGEAAGGIDSGGALQEGAGGIGGAASGRSGAAGAGGRTADGTLSTALGATGAAGAGGRTADGTFSGSAGAAGDSGGAADDAFSALAGAGNGATIPPPGLFFSEYVEGSSSNKALEVAAYERSALDGCKIVTYFNGKSEASVVALLSGALEAGQVLTVCTSTLKAKLASACNQVGNLTFNGNDAIALTCNGVPLDVIGQIGVDPGAGWGIEPNTTVDHSLRRNCNVTSGAQSNSIGPGFDPSRQWQAFPADTFDGLGARGC